MLDELIIDVILAIYAVIVAILFGIMHRSKGFLTFWFQGTIVNGIATVLFLFRHIDSVYRILGNAFYFLAALILGYSVFKEYNRIFIQKNIKLKNGFEPLIFPLIFIQLSPIDLIQASLLSFNIIIVILLTRIFLNEKSITHIFMLLAVVASLFTLFFSILYNHQVLGSWECAYISKVVFISCLFGTGLSAPMEDRLYRSEKKYRESYSRAELYKDLFAHDMSNILQNILSSMELLGIHSSQEDNELKDIISEQVNKGKTLIYNVRRLSEIENREIQLERFDIIPIIKDSIEKLKQEFKDKYINIETDYSDSIYLVKADGLLSTLFDNILNNSVKHNYNSEIFISIEILKVEKEGSNYIKFKFIDNSIGIPDDLKEKVFKRALSEDRTLYGMGLSLSIIKKVVDGYKGDIWIEDKVPGDFSQGICLNLLIPEA